MQWHVEFRDEQGKHRSAFGTEADALRAAFRLLSNGFRVTALGALGVTLSPAEIAKLYQSWQRARW